MPDRASAEQPLTKATILVIKLGALGDFVQATGPFAAIRRHHADARLVLLTLPSLANFARSSGWFDEIWIDARPRPWQVGGWLALRRHLRQAGIARVYDLQTSDRSSTYFRLFWPGPWPKWSGIAAGCSHPHANPNRDAMHTIERQAEQLRMAGIAVVPAPNVSWAEADLGRFDLPDRYVFMAPGAAAGRPEKRWPLDRFAELVRRLDRRGLRSVLIGGADERPLHDELRAQAGTGTSLAGRTDLTDLAALARGAVAAVGNDSGPMHVASVAGCPTVVLYSGASDPTLCGQRGPKVAILRHPSFADLNVDAVEDTMLGLMSDADATALSDDG